MKWIRVAIYYGIALLIAASSRFYWHTADIVASERSIWSIYWHLVSSAGPFLGAVIVWKVFRPQRQISFGGSWPSMGLAMLAVPALVMGVLGVTNPFAVEPHLLGIHLGIWIALYAVLEETGWRGYLQSEFKDRSPLLKYAIVGVFWYAWHFSWLGGYPIQSEIITLAFMVLASLGIGFVADRTQSIFAAAAFHVIGNIMGLTTEFTTLLPSSHTRGIMVLICVVLWLVMLRLWRMRDVRAQSRAPA